MIYIIDRLEGDFLILEDENKRISKLHISTLNFTVKENEIIEFKNGTFIKRNDLMINRKKQIDDLTKDLFKEE